MSAAPVMSESALQVCGTGDGEVWRAALSEASQSDFYHLPGYHELAESRGEGVAKLFVYREEESLIALPLLLRPIPGEGATGLDATSVYGYAGPVASAGVPERVRQNFRQALREHLRGLGVVTVFSRLHPLLAQRELLSGLGDCVPGGQTVSIDLRLPLDLQRVQFRGDHKRGINRNRRNGLTVVEDVGLDHLDRFHALYTATMRRVNAAPYYFFEPDYFAALATHLGPALKLFIVWDGAEPVCAGLFTICRGIVQYHLGGTADRALEQAPMKLLFDEVRLWATAQGQTTLHLGGGVGSQADSLFHFKAGFSDSRHDFFTWRWVLDHGRYARLCALKGSPATGFFPRYRATA